MKSKYTELKEELLKANTLHKIECVFKKIENAWFELESKTETHVMLNSVIIKWNNLYDDACAKHLTLQRKFSKLLDELIK